VKCSKDIWLIATLLSVLATIALFGLLALSMTQDWETEKGNRAMSKPRSHLPMPGSVFGCTIFSSAFGALSYWRYSKLLGESK
jgi:hypothetical protein